MWAMPSYGQQNPKGNLLVRFITDASQRNGASRHHVTIEFNGYQTALSSGAHAANRAARIMAKDQIKFDCDCGRHTFWYRYITTVGNFNSGRAETGYPKIRNPNLQGVACKHVLRVMAEIEGNGNILSFLTKAIEKARKQVGNKTKVQTSQKDADQQILKQNSRSTTKLDSREERNLHRSRIALRKSTKVARKAMPKPQIMASASRKMSHLGKMENNKNSEAILLQTIKGLGITPEQAMAIMKTMKT